MSQQGNQVPKLPPSAAGWVKWHDWNAQAFRPVTTWVCDATKVAAGHRVLALGPFVEGGRVFLTATPLCAAGRRD